MKMEKKLNNKIKVKNLLKRKGRIEWRIGYLMKKE